MVCSGRAYLPGRPSQGDRAGLVETRSLKEGVENFFRDGLVHGDCHRRAGTGLAAPDGHVADVDVVLPEDAAELPDHARPILVADEKHVLLGHHVEIEAHGFDEARLHPWPEERPANGVLTHAQLDEVRVVRALRRPRGLDLEPPLLRKRGRVDEVQGLEDHRREESFLRRDVEEACVESGDLAPVFDPERIIGAVRELVEQTSQRLAQARELGHELGALPHRYGGVYGVYRHGAPEGCRHLLGSRDACPVLGLRGARAEVGRHYHVGEREDRGVRRRLLGEYIECGTGDGALLEGVVEGRLVDDAATGHVYEVRGRLHLRQGFFVHESYRLGGARNVYRDEIGPLEDLVSALCPLDVHRAHPVLGDIGIIGEDPHPHPQCAPCHDGADVTKTDQPDRLLRHLDTFERAPLPLPTPQGRVRGRDTPRHSEHEPQGMLGRGDRVALRGVGDDDAVLGSGLYIYVVNADAGASDSLEVNGPPYYIGGDFRSAADDETVVIPDLLEQFFRAEVEEDVHLEILL